MHGETNETRPAKAARKSVGSGTSTLPSSLFLRECSSEETLLISCFRFSHAWMKSTMHLPGVVRKS
jgi:hypothetical protein